MPVRVELDTSEDVLHDVYAFLVDSARDLEDQDALPDHVRDLRAAARTIRSALDRERRQ